MRRCGVDDAAPFARLHARHGSAASMERGGEVDGDDLVPFLDREILDRINMLNAGVVDQHIHRAERLLGVMEIMSAISAGLLMSAAE